MRKGTTGLTIRHQLKGSAWIMAEARWARMSKLKRALLGIPVVFLGSALSRTWVRSTTPLLSNTPVLFGLTPGNLFDASGAVCALVLALFSTRIEASRKQPALAGAGGCAASLATLMISLSRFLDLGADLQAILAGLAGILGGAGFMALSLTWCTFYMAFNPARMIVFSCTSQLVSDLLIFAVQGYNSPQLDCLLVLLPLAAWWSYRRSVARLSPEDIPQRTPNARPFPWKPVLFLAVYAFAYSIAESSSGVLTGYPEMFLYLIPPALFVVGAVLQPRRFSLRAIYLVVCPLMLCALLLPVALPNLHGGVAAAFISLGYDSSKIIGSLILGSLSYRLGISPLWLVGISRTFSYTGLLLGDRCCQELALADGGLSAPLCALLALCVAVVSLVLFTERGLDDNWAMLPRGSARRGSASSLSPEETAGDQAAPAMAIARARAVFDLTAREEEVLCLLVQGKNVPAIAADMFLAQGTVKAHVQHIYQKMDVHSRPELIARIDAL